MSDSNNVPVEQQTVTVIAEDIWPEGYLTYGVFGSPEAAMAAVDTNLELFKSAINRGDLYVDVIPLNQLNINAATNSRGAYPGDIYNARLKRFTPKKDGRGWEIGS